MLKHFLLKKTTVFLTSLLVCLFCAPVAMAGTDIPISIIPVDSILKLNWNQVSMPCTFCLVMEIFFDAANYLALQAAIALEGPMLKLLALGAAFWILFQTIIYFSKPFSELDAADYLTKVGGMLFKCLMATVFIHNGCYFVFNYILGSLFATVAGLVQAIGVVNGANVLDSSFASANNLPGAFSSDVRESVMGIIGGFTSGLNELKKYGFFLIYNGLAGFRIPDPAFTIPFIDFEIYFGFPNPLMIVWGLLLLIIFSIVGFVYSITFLDVIFRMALTMVFVPIFTVAWVFPSTRKYSKAVLVFVCTTIFLTMIAQLARDAFGDDFVRYMRQTKPVEAWWSLSIPNIWYVRNYLPFFNIWPLLCSLLVGIIAITGSKIPDEVAAHFSGSGFHKIENCGRKTIKFICNTIIQIACLALTICTWGAATPAPVGETAREVEQTIEQIQRMEDYIKKMKELRKKLRRLQQIAQQASKNLDF